jgi:hypothetical protein
MGAGAFDLLKTRGNRPRRVKQPEPGLAGLRTILSIYPDPAVMQCAAASSGYPGKVAGEGAMFTIAAGPRVIELTLSGGLARRDYNVFRIARAGCRLTNDPAR